LHGAGRRGPASRHVQAGSRHGTADAGGRSRVSMTDLVIIALTVALFAATVGFARLCERM
jgi:hypothetical protein